MTDEDLLQHIFDLMHEDAIKQGYEDTEEERERFREMHIKAADEFDFMSFRAGWFTAMQGVLSYLRDQEDHEEKTPNGLKWKIHRTNVGEMRELGLWREYCAKYNYGGKDDPDEVGVILDEYSDAGLIKRIERIMEENQSQ